MNTRIKVWLNNICIWFFLSFISWIFHNSRPFSAVTSDARDIKFYHLLPEKEKTVGGFIHFSQIKIKWQGNFGQTTFVNYAKHVICCRGVTIHIPCDLIHFQLLLGFDFAYFNLIMQNTNVFFFFNSYNMTYNVNRGATFLQSNTKWYTNECTTNV